MVAFDVEAWRGKRVLVTGGGGVLGSALSAALETLRPAALAVPRRADCDFLDGKATTAFFQDFQPDVVFHLAGKVSGVQGNISFGGEAFYENTLINLNVIEAARLAKASKVVAAGTAAIYSDAAKLPMSEADFWTDAPHGSEAPYGHAKRAMLAQLQAYKTQYGLDYAYMICTNLFGPNDRFDEVYGHVVPSLVARFARSVEDKASQIVIWGNGAPTRDFLFSADAAAAFIRAAEAGEGAYNTATGHVVSIRELVETLQKISGFEGEIVWDRDKPLGQLTRSYDVSRLTALGWAPHESLEEGLRKTCEWYAANRAAARA
ncbi:NAD-dependent epimerase/dehydratase family protein [Caulobacter sp.]|uniref:NAD-dependent epimerase/dehydratase family protein n=1 Tax=Caulobacter sp. TaxID=78 RepID=UPI003BAFA7BF